MNDILIPPEITRICCVSGHIFLLAGILFLCKNGGFIFGCLLILLYITTILLWKCLAVDTFYRTVDRFMVFAVTVYSAVYFYALLPFYIYIQYLCVFIVAGSLFYANETWYFYCIEQPKIWEEYGEHTYLHPLIKMETEKRRGVVLRLDDKTQQLIQKYLYPIISHNRINGYYMNVCIHAIFVHLLVGISIIYVGVYY